MACDIRSKSGLNLHMGYGTFHWMRGECLEQMCKGFGNFYEWACFGNSGLLSGIEVKYTDDGAEYQLPWKSSAREFGDACYVMLENWLKANGFGFAWRHFFLHCDCGGGWTAKQCKRLVKDLDRMSPGERGRDAFIAFREIFREAAKRNEGLKIS